MTTLLRNRPVTASKPATADQPIRILLVEDHPVVSSGLAALLNDEPGWRVCGITQDYASALEMMEALHPDLIISDICLRGRDGLELLRKIKARRPQQRVLMLSMHDELFYAPRALQAGAAGYVMKQETVETLFAAIRKVIRGEVYFSEPIKNKMLRRFFMQKSDAPALDPLETLTGRELEVFLMIGQAKSTREIASTLELSVKTIESYRGRLKRKLNLATARDLLRYALSQQKDEFGLKDPPLHADWSNTFITSKYGMSIAPNRALQ